MIVVTEVKTIKTDRDIYDVMHMTPMEPIWDIASGDAVPADTIQREIIHGQRFVRNDGTDFVLGATVEAQKELGLAIFLFDRMQSSIDTHLKTIRTQKDELKNIRSATLWQRIKWLFSGIQ